MKKSFSKIVPAMLVVALCAALAPLNQAQVGSSITRISTTPTGLVFNVDGQNYTNLFAAVWPAGSKHSLLVNPLQFATNTQYIFQGWSWSGGTVPGGNQVTVTADPSIGSYQALFQIEYALNVQFNPNPCPQAPCPGPGTVYVNGAPLTYDQQLYFPANSAVTIQAVPGDGFVFAGWGAGVAQAITGAQNVITLTSPMTVYPIFQWARQININSIPSGLQILADTTALAAPTSLQWGIGSVHALGVVSPQTDNHGVNWVFSSWSDNGAANHAYTVANVVSADNVTATFVPGAQVTFGTNPQGLSLSVDGRSNWPTYNFLWGVGETYTVSAPAQQIDSAGRTYVFSSWSNGSTTAQQTVTVPASAATAGLRLTANYTAVGHLTVNSPVAGLSVSVNGAPCAVPCDVYQPTGTQMVVSTPASLGVPGSTTTRQDFLSWTSGSGALAADASGNLNLTLGADPIVVSANYHWMNYLAAVANPTGGATFTTQPASPDGFFDAQTSVTVKAAALPGYHFRNWSGDLSGTGTSGTLAMTAPHMVQAQLITVPYISPSGVVNGAGTTPQGVVAPGSVVSIFGANLGSSVAVGPASPMTQTLGGVTVSLQGRLLPLFFVSPTQVNFELPPDIATGDSTVVVSSIGQPDTPAAISVVADAPGLFPGSVQNQQTFALIAHADGSAVTTDSPAQQGELLTLYGTGFGASSPMRPTGLALPSSPAYALTDPITVMVGSATYTPVNAYALPGTVGVDAIQFMLDSSAPTATNAPLVITINGQASNTVLLPVQ